ncbi:YceI family protein [Phenylobacterium immobile]|uniref:YceI family protein n=1 Tax=Phenylobacterium immobile TaxID=21 RepID=UPI000B211532|nr:YceI family protein [Phenylobacterium immobile]
MNSNFLVAAAAVIALSGCGKPAEKAAAPPATAAETVNLTIPAGVYKLDPNHAYLQWSVPHMGLSTYRAKFTRYDATVTLDPANLEASKVSVTIDPLSIRTDYPADYKATHAKSGYATWDEELGKSDRFAAGAKFPTITFNSTKVERTGPSTAKVTGDLTFAGVTKPVTLDVTLVGQTATHPFTKGGAFGVHAEGGFKRTDFGQAESPMNDISISFDAEFQQELPATPAAG